MIHSNLGIEVQGSYILVALRGICFRAKYRKKDAPWLAMDEYAEDPEASITLTEFRNLAWEAANEKARHLGWVKKLRWPARGRKARRWCSVNKGLKSALPRVEIGADGIGFTPSVSAAYCGKPGLPVPRPGGRAVAGRLAAASVRDRAGLRMSACECRR